jgi:hypothetical protein
MNATSRTAVWAAAALVMAAAGAATIRAQTAQTPRSSAGRASEGVTVHGYWKIDVRNPDGSLVSHTEFENALTTDGSLALVRLMHGTSAVNFMYIRLDGPDVNSSVCTWPLLTIMVPYPCVIVPPGSPSWDLHQSSTNTFPNLTSAVQSSPSGALVLSGAITAAASSTINTVSTALAQGCPALGAEVPCDFSADLVASLSTLTQFSLAPDQSHPTSHPIAVAAGQVIQVSVTLSFS